MVRSLASLIVSVLPDPDTVAAKPVTFVARATLPSEVMNRLLPVTSPLPVVEMPPFWLDSVTVLSTAFTGPAITRFPAAPVPAVIAMEPLLVTAVFDRICRPLYSETVSVALALRTTAESLATSVPTLADPAEFSTSVSAVICRGLPIATVPLDKSTTVPWLPASSLPVMLMPPLVALSAMFVDPLLAMIEPAPPIWPLAVMAMRPFVPVAERLAAPMLMPSASLIVSVWLVPLITPCTLFTRVLRLAVRPTVTSSTLPVTSPLPEMARFTSSVTLPEPALTGPDSCSEP